MNKKLFNFVIILVLVLAFFSTDVKHAQAALPNPQAVLPIPVDKTAKYSQGAHKSGFNMNYITNRGQQNSSIDLGYSGQIVAPITGILAIAKSCTDHQIVFIRADRGSNGSGWAVGLTHVWVDPKLNGKEVTQGQVIGKTVPPPPAPGKGCGYGKGSHIHYTLMKWKMGSKGPLYTEQSIVNTYIAQWIVKDTYLDGPYTDIAVGKMIEDRIKITSVRSGKVITYSSGIRIWSYSSNDNQKWIRIAAPDTPGFYYLKRVSHNECMVAENSNNGIKITISTCDGKDHRQRFKFQALPEFPGQVAIVNKASGKVLDVITNWNDPASGKKDGTRIQQWDPFYGDNQRWKVSKP